jgi:hypothetical protein
MLLEKIYERILHEAGRPDTGGLACYIQGRRGQRGDYLSATVYDVSGIEESMSTSPECFVRTSITGRYKPLVPHIRGWSSITPMKQPCWGAYTISTIAGPGKLVYGLAYAMSPNGLLISDCGSMSKDALSAWKNMSIKGTRDRKKLDDFEDPKTPSPEDDCALRKEEYLNYAYDSEGWEKDMLNSMVARHESLVERLSEEMKREDFEYVIFSAGNMYFNKMYF